MQQLNKDTFTTTGIGSRLRAAREAMNMSDKDAAARLHLSVKFINIMENEDFQNGPPATFIRGYMRSYAKMLNLPLNEVDAAIDGLGMGAPATVIATPKIHSSATVRNQEERYIRWITYLIIAILFILVVMWWNSHTRDTAADTANKIQTQSLIPTQVTTTTSPTTNPAQPAPVAATAPAPAGATTPATPAAAGTAPVIAVPAPTAVAPAAAPAVTPSTTNNPPAAPSVAGTPPISSVPVTPGTATPAAPGTPTPVAVAPGTTAQTPAAPGTAQPTTAVAQPGTQNPDSTQSTQGKSSEPQDVSHMKMIAPEPGLMGDDY